MDDRLVVAITGASGAIYGIRVLELLRELPVETHLVLSKWARVTIEQETAYALADVRALADVTWAENDQAAAISSGSFKTRGMIVAPCSTKTLAAIATGFSHNLVCRAADVTLKERRPLVLAVREAPLSSIHLRNMLALSYMGDDPPAHPGVLHAPGRHRRHRRVHGAAHPRPARPRRRIALPLERTAGDRRGLNRASA